jgi:heme/copper-type cytochrome/quinol oxidase subunit 2
MKLQQQPTDAIRDRLVETIGIGALVLFGVIMVFFGWLKYRDRNNPTKTKPRKRSKNKANK